VWEKVAISLADTTNRLRFRFSGTTSIVFEVRNMRAADSTAPAAGFPDGSPAGTDYPVDLLSCSPTFANKGTIVVALEPYYWSDWANHPASGVSRILSTAGFNWEIVGTGGDATIFRATSGEDVAISKSPVSGELCVVSFDWDEDTKIAGARFDDSGRQTFTYTNKPAGTLYPGNNQNGDRPLHGIHSIPIFDRVLSDVDFETLRSGYQARLGGSALV